MTVSCLTFHGAEFYKAPPTGDKREEVQWIDFPIWALGSFKDVDALVEGLKSIVLVDRFAPVLPAFTRTHWAVADASGRSIVVEVRDGEPVVYENAVGTLTNGEGCSERKGREERRRKKERRRRRRRREEEKEKKEKKRKQTEKEEKTLVARQSN